MTGGFNTIVSLPMEGSTITEHKTKKEAEDAYNEDLKNVNAGYYLGASLVKLEIVKEIGNWR